MNHKTFGAKLKIARNSAKKSVSEISEYLTAKGYKASEKTIYSWESGRSQPTPDALLDLCHFCGIEDILLTFGFKTELTSTQIKQKNAAPKVDTADSIAARYQKLDEHGKLVVCAVVSEEERRIKTAKATKNEDKVIHIRWNDQPVSAGSPFELGNEHLKAWVVRYNELTRKADFCLNVHGCSMEPKFFDGDIVLIRQQPSVDIGEIGLFLVDRKGYIKEQGTDRLISLNPEDKDIWPCECSVILCAGKVIGVLKPEWIISK